MPLYDFECPECNHTFEQELPMGAPAPACPECGSDDVERQISPPPVIFKGDGFYKTDSAKTVKKEGADTKKGKKPEKDDSEKKPKESQKSKPEEK